MKNKIFFSTLLLILLPGLSVSLYSQEADIISPYVDLKYFKNSSDQRYLQTALTYSMNRMELPLPGMEIKFYSGDTPKELIGTVNTDNKGIARLDLGSDLNLKSDRDGMWIFSTEFNGNDTIEAGIYEITVRDVLLEMILEEVDSVRTITVNASVNDNEKKIPVADEIVTVYIPRMFSMLPIGDITLDESGTGSIEFPADLPGDKEGNITIVTKFEENMTFGNVEKTETLKWGLPTDYSVPKTHRALWTKTAPKWMIYTLSILLAGVWGHYLFAIISLIRIKSDADRIKAKEEFRM